MVEISDKNAIENLLKDRENRHSDFQIETFIIKAKVDTWAQYKQCLREISARYESITKKENMEKAISAGIKKDMRFKLWRFLRSKLFAWNGSMLGIRLPDGNIDDLKAELDCLVKIAKKLKADLGEITPEKRYKLESESWKAKGLKMAAVDILATGRISNQTYDFILSLPRRSQIEIFEKLSSSPPMRLLGFDPNEINNNMKGNHSEIEKAKSP